MCLEDVKLGRETSRMDTYPAVTATAAQVLVQRPKRVALILSNAGTNPIFIGFTAGVAAGAGLLLAVNSGPLKLDIQKDGAMITEGLFAICAAAQTSVLAIWETLLEK